MEQSEDASRAVPATVVVISYNRSQELHTCLRSLMEQTHRPLEIVVVDDASTDDTQLLLKRLERQVPTGVSLLARRHDRNQGIGRSRNTGIEAATGEIIAFTDDDCVAQPDWVAELVRTFSDAEDIGVVGGRIEEPEERSWAQRAAEGINFLGVRDRYVAAVNGCNMACRASFLREHPFDSQAEYGDDLDRCFFAAAAGLRVRYNPRARVTHHHRRSVWGFLRQQFMRGKGSAWVRRKHRRGLWPKKNWLPLALLLAASALLFPGPGPLTLGLAIGLAAIFLLQILALDRLRGKSLVASLVTLPLVALGYYAELSGAIIAVLRRGRPCGRAFGTSDRNDA